MRVADSGEASFTHTGFALSANTKYFLVVGGALLEHVSAKSGAEDSGKAPAGLSTTTNYFHDGGSWLRQPSGPYQGLCRSYDATGKPAITGTWQEGLELTAGIGTIADADGLPTTFPDDYTFQWIRVAADDTETDIGLDQNTYKLVAADVGGTIKVKVFTDARHDESYQRRLSVLGVHDSCKIRLPRRRWCATMRVGMTNET